MSTAIDTWQVTRMRGSFNISHPWIAQAPGCPNERHPHRWCACKVHRTKAEAEAYVTEMEGQS